MTDARFPYADLPARVISSQERPIVWFRNMIHTLASTFKGIFLRETGCEVIPSRRNLPSSAAVSDDFGMQLSAEAHHNIRQLKPHCHTGWPGIYTPCQAFATIRAKLSASNEVIVLWSGSTLSASGFKMFYKSENFS